MTFVVDQVFRVSSRESPIFVGKLEGPALRPGSRLMTPHGEIVTVLGIDLACGRGTPGTGGRAVSESCSPRIRVTRCGRARLCTRTPARAATAWWDLDADRSPPRLIRGRIEP